MNDYEFTLRFALPSPETDMDLIVDALYGQGCDDALIGIGRPGRLGLDFTRGAESARAAVLSAIADVRRAVPGATLVEVTPDLVGVADLAFMFSCSRQNMWKLIMGDCSTAPAPAHEGKSSLWHLGPLLRWLARREAVRRGPPPARPGGRDHGRQPGAGLPPRGLRTPNGNCDTCSRRVCEPASLTSRPGRRDVGNRPTPGHRRLRIFGNADDACPCAVPDRVLELGDTRPWDSSARTAGVVAGAIDADVRLVYRAP